MRTVDAPRSLHDQVDVLLAGQVDIHLLGCEPRGEGAGLIEILIVGVHGEDHVAGETPFQADIGRE